MYIEYVAIKEDLTPINKKNHNSSNENVIRSISGQENKDTANNESQITRLTDRALLLLSFKDVSTQNLKYVWEVLDIKTLDQKQNILKEIYRLIREGMVYVPRGFTQLIHTSTQVKIGNQDDIEDIELCLLRPYDKLIREIQKEIAELHTIDTPEVNSY